MNQNFSRLTARWSMPCIASMLMLSSAHATKPMMEHTVVGCVVSKQFVPYADQKIHNAQKIPYWVRRATNKKLEGQELRLNWGSPIGSPYEVDNYCRTKSCSVSVMGPCERSRLANATAG